MALYVEARPPQQSSIFLSRAEVNKLAHKGILPNFYLARIVNGALELPTAQYTLEEIADGGIKVYRVYEG